MKEIFEAAIGMFFITMLTIVSMACITASIDAKNADTTKTMYIAEIEDSHFAAQVLQNVFIQVAKDDKYDVKMTVYHKYFASQPESTNSITTANGKDGLFNSDGNKVDIASLFNPDGTVRDGIGEMFDVDGNPIIGNTSDVYMVRLELTFAYSFNYLDDYVTHNLIGYAR